jgi:hypothetical protein
VIAIEACGASHHCARLLQSFGHSVKLIAPQLVKPYVKRGKNDAADAEALCEAMSRPTMRFVPVKTAQQQATLMLVGGSRRTGEGSSVLLAGRVRAPAPARTSERSGSRHLRVGDAVEAFGFHRWSVLIVVANPSGRMRPPPAAY